MDRHCTNCSPAATHCLPIYICGWHYCDRHYAVAFLRPISMLTTDCLDSVELATCANYHLNWFLNFPNHCLYSMCKCHYFVYSNLQIERGEKKKMNKIAVRIAPTKNSCRFICILRVASRHVITAYAVHVDRSMPKNIFPSFHLDERAKHVEDEENLRGTTANGKWWPNRDTKPNNLFDKRFVWFGSFIKTDWINGLTHKNELCINAIRLNIGVSHI